MLLPLYLTLRFLLNSGSIQGNRRTSLVKSVNVDEFKKTENVGTRLIEKEESATGSISLSVYWRYFRSLGVWMGPVSIFMLIANQGFSVYSNLWLTMWSSDPNAREPSVRDRYVGVYGGLGILLAISLLIGSFLFGLGCLNAAKYFHNKLLAHSFRLPMSFFDTTPTGRILNRFSKDIDTLDNTLPQSMRSWLNMLFMMLATLFVIGYATPIFLVVILPIGILFYVAQVFYVATSRQLKRIESVTRSPIYSHFGESLGGQMTIRAYGKDQEFTRDNALKVDHNQKCAYLSFVANRWLSVRLDLVSSLIVLFASLFAVLGRETLDPSIVGLSVSYTLHITQLAWLVRMAAEVETNIVAIERLEEYSELEQEAARTKGTIDPTWPKDGRVEFKDLKVRYREGLDLVLKGISFNVEPTQKIGIVGRTGAGKSSLTLALFR